jgi:ABC-type multidrug transport system ATPase subunit
MIRIDNVNLILANRTIFRHLNARAGRGEKVAVSGVSGAGKTTLLKLLIGQHQPSQGSIFIDGLSLGQDNLPAIRKRLFYLPQEVRALPLETTREYLERPFRLAVNRGYPCDMERARTTFEQLHLRQDLLERPLNTLSGGERKRIGLVRALLLDRPVMLLDELTSSVDAQNRDDLLDLVLGLETTTVLAVTHDQEMMKRAGSHWNLHNGHIHRSEER